MSDNVALPAATGKAASREVTYSGEVAQVQAVGVATFSGSDDAKTATDVPGGSGTSAGALRVELPTDGTGVVARVGELTGGGIANDAADSGNPVKVGGRAVTTRASAAMVDASDRADLLTDVDGLLLTKPFAPGPDILVERLSNTDGASTASTVFDATASARNNITTIAVYNDSTTGGYIDFRDGTAGTIIFTLPLPAKGGAVCNFPLPMRQPTANTALAIDVSAALTTVYVSLVGFKSKA